MTLLGHDVDDVEALITDRYLESLMAVGRPAVAAGIDPLDLDEGVRLAALRLRRDLPRFHPSFRFEERLALKLAAAASRVGVPAAAGAEGVVVPFAARTRERRDDFDPRVGAVGGAGAGLQALPAAGDGSFDLMAADRGTHRTRPLLIGGAMASAAISIAGAAWVAWRRSRPASTAALGDGSVAGRLD
ncbi:MAG TPA: hypothetical protein VIM30_03590 [Candidatus Limnocylindrales bacterium]